MKRKKKFINLNILYYCTPFYIMEKWDGEEGVSGEGYI